LNGRIIRDNEIERCRVPVIGKLKVGYKTDKGYPQSVDYFIPDGNYKHLFSDKFGAKPNDIPIVFLSDCLQDVCNERLEIRTKNDNDAIGGRLFAFGNGKEFSVWKKEKKDYVFLSINDVPDLMAMCEQRTGNKWQSVLTLRFLIPDICQILGVWQLTTKGESSSIPQIRDAFDTVKNLSGSVTYKVFILSVDKVVSQKPDSKATYPVIKIYPKINDTKKFSALVSGQNVIEYKE